MKERTESQLPMNVVVRTEDGAVSFLVDEIGDVIEVECETLESPPETLRGPTRSVITGVYKLPRRLLLALDIDRVTDASDLAKPKSNREF